MRVIECESLTKEYKDHKALKDVSFTIDSIGCVGFLGGNGAGKTDDDPHPHRLGCPDSGQGERSATMS
ncbi:MULTISPECIES: hypothetical protein [Brevibacillus]|uniref:hypothetical protein n=1 Tax=Brevibacillus TaxID=55080 RepID=UPI0002EA8E1D|nr:MULTISPECIES: hypothetical protein [Brevibacillus]MDN4095958.1 hypothetical protein [Brevibacillus agri]MED4568831.1 hypothetical protein [Brevibacillus agri]